MQVRLIKKEPLAENIITFWFEPEKPIRYIAGQYIELYIPHSNPDERKERRWFTLSSSPIEEYLSITTRIINPRRSTFKNALNQLKIGDEIKMLPPMGDFVLPKDETIPLLFLAKGIGVTPFRSMLKYLNDNDKKLDIKFIYSVNNTNYVIFKDIIEKATNNLIVHKGTLGARELLDYIKDAKERIVYMAGPEKMIENLQKDLIKNDFNPTQIRTDFFHNYD